MSSIKIENSFGVLETFYGEYVFGTYIEIQKQQKEYPVSVRNVFRESYNFNEPEYEGPRQAFKQSRRDSSESIHNVPYTRSRTKEIEIVAKASHKDIPNKKIEVPMMERSSRRRTRQEERKAESTEKQPPRTFEEKEKIIMNVEKNLLSLQLEKQKVFLM